MPLSRSPNPFTHTLPSLFKQSVTATAEAMLFHEFYQLLVPIYGEKGSVSRFVYPNQLTKWDWRYVRHDQMWNTFPLGNVHTQWKQNRLISFQTVFLLSCLNWNGFFFKQDCRLFVWYLALQKFAIINKSLKNSYLHASIDLIKTLYFIMNHQHELSKRSQ